MTHEIISIGRLAALKSGQKPDRVPVLPFVSGYAAKLCGMSLKEFFTDVNKCIEAQLLAKRIHDWDGSPYYGWAEWGGAVFGGSICYPQKYEEMAPHMMDYPVTSPRDVDKIDIPDPRSAGLYPNHIKFNRVAVAGGLTPSVRAGSPTSMVASMTGLTNLLDWYLSEPEAVKVLYQKANAFLLEAVEVMASEFGSSLLAWFSCPVDSNNLISPKTFEKFGWPALKEIIEGVQKRGVTQFFVHLCGNNRGNLAAWADLPWPDKTIISIDSCMDLVQVAEAFGHKHIIAGNVPTDVMAEGTFLEVYEASRNCVEKGKELPGGFILMPACELPVQTAPLNVSVFVQAAKDFGIYGN